MREVESEVVKWSVLQAEGAQRAPVNLSCQVAEEEPGRPLLLLLLLLADGHVGAVAPAVGGDGRGGGRPAGVTGRHGAASRLLVERAGEAPEVLTHGRQVGLPTHLGHTPAVLHLKY